MGGLKLRRFSAVAAVVVFSSFLLALAPAAIVPGSAGLVLTTILLVLLCLALSVPNLMVHLTRRVTVHHRGSSRTVYYSITTGDAGLRRRICGAFEDEMSIEPASIEGLEHPRGSGVVYPLSLVAAAVDSLLGSDCDLAILRPEPNVTRFRWADLQSRCSTESAGEVQLQHDFARCLAARGYCIVKMPPEHLSAPATVFEQVRLAYVRSIWLAGQTCNHY